MSASDHLQPHQLAMFMPAGHIVNTHVLGDGRVGKDGVQTPEQKAEVMSWKRQDNAMRSPERTGSIRTPVVIGHGFSAGPSVMEGHHRLTGAYDRSPHEEVPVIHLDSSRESWVSGREYYPQSF